MAWHAGNSLSQTFYTLLHVHYLRDINPDFLPHRLRRAGDPQRPLELITVVLRGALFGMLKSCDLSWRELSKGKVHEIEDWFGEKCDVSLLEGVAAHFALRKLDDACEWLRHSDLPASEITRLCNRLLLRQTLVQLLMLTPPLDVTEMRDLITTARELLQAIRVDPISTPTKGSPALLVFDPFISRRLPNFMPVKAVELPHQDETWDMLDRFLRDYEELSVLLDSLHVTTWEVAGSLRVYSQEQQVSVAYLRSLTQSVVFDRDIIFGQFPPMWLVNQFFVETIGVTHDIVLQTLELGENASVQSLARDIERRIVDLMIAHIRSHWYNPPRRRRYLAKSILHWHELYDQLLQLVAHCPSTDREDNSILELVPMAASMRRLAAAREVILSAFEQELYAPEEVPIAYWYLSRILETHLECIDEVLAFTAEGWEGYEEIAFQASFLTALQLMAVAMCGLTYKQATLPYERTALNFIRRYKWASRPEYEPLVDAEPLPDLRLFFVQASGLAQDEYFSASLSFLQAGDILRSLIDSRRTEGLAGIWASSRRDFITDLADVCRRLEAVPTSTREFADFDNKSLRWQERAHPWFPDIVA